MQRSGSCSVVSEGSPSSTMLSRNWAKGVPRCSGRGAHRVCRPAPLPHTTLLPWRYPIPVRLLSAGPQALGPWVPAGCGLPTVSWPATSLLTIVCVGHCLPHGEDHGQDEGRVTQFLVVWGGKAGSQSPYIGWQPPPAPEGRKLPSPHPAYLSACPGPAPQAAQMTQVWR